MDYLVEQLWAPVLSTGEARVEINPPTDPEWVDAEAYWLVPDARRARLLLPRADSRVTAAAASNYRGLRGTAAHTARAAAAAGARLHLPLSPSTARLQVRRGSKVTRALPLARLRSALGSGPLYASTGVRTGANRKATLSLVDGQGSPVGYAKFGWNEVTDAFVRTEAASLRTLGVQDGLARAPRLLAELKYGGHPVLVTEPLPLEARGGHRVSPPTPQELSALLPVHRWAAVAETTHFQQVRARLGHLATLPVSQAAATAALRLVDAVAGDERPLPVAARWHGDLTSWNCARDAQDRLWVWDWETAEPDAAAGLDAVHWAFSERRLRVSELGDIDLRDCLSDAAPQLTAAGLPRSQWPTVAALYVLTLVERASALAANEGSWRAVWIQPATLAGFLAQGTVLLPRR